MVPQLVSELARIRGVQCQVRAQLRLDPASSTATSFASGTPFSVNNRLWAKAWMLAGGMKAARLLQVQRFRSRCMEIQFLDEHPGAKGPA